MGTPKPPKRVPSADPDFPALQTHRAAARPSICESWPTGRSERKEIRYDRCADRRRGYPGHRGRRRWLSRKRRSAPDAVPRPRRDRTAGSCSRSWPRISRSGRSTPHCGWPGRGRHARPGIPGPGLARRAARHAAAASVLDGRSRCSSSSNSEPAAVGVPVDSRIERGRTPRHALRQAIAQERFDRIVIAAASHGSHGFNADDVAWLLDHAQGEIVVLRPGAEDQLSVGRPAVPGRLRPKSVALRLPRGNGRRRGFSRAGGTATSR